MGNGKLHNAKFVIISFKALGGKYFTQNALKLFAKDFDFCFWEKVTFGELQYSRKCFTREIEYCQTPNGATLSFEGRRQLSLQHHHHHRCHNISNTLSYHRQDLYSCKSVAKNGSCMQNNKRRWKAYSSNTRSTFKKTTRAVAKFNQSEM